MPYYVYQLYPNKKLTYVNDYPKYKEAKSYVKAQRPQITAADNYQLRIMFAGSQSEAERLFTTKREAQPLREDDM